MLLIDAVFINNGGGRVLLDYLFEQVAAHTERKTVFLIDDRIRSAYAQKDSVETEVVFIRSFFERNRYYKKHGSVFTSVLCFGNIPPGKRVKAQVFTYFQQRLFLEVPKEFGWTARLKFKVKSIILRQYKNNTDYWLVQNSAIAQKLSEVHHIPGNSIKILPFYPPFAEGTEVERVKNSFLYIGSAAPHKNHLRLVEAFCRFYDAYKTGKLTVTVEPVFEEVYHLINEKTAMGYPIVNLGFISRDRLYSYYRESEYVVFPSLSESFGLGIVEGIENGCKIIGSDLPYMHEVCTPSMVFNPQSVDDIYRRLCKTQSMHEIPKSEQKVFNEINQLLDLIGIAI